MIQDNVDLDPDFYIETYSKAVENQKKEIQAQKKQLELSEKRLEYFNDCLVYASERKAVILANKRIT